MAANHIKDESAASLGGADRAEAHQLGDFGGDSLGFSC
jgi:hypothetical protein